MAILPASILILDDRHEQLQLAYILCVMFWRSKLTPKREAKIWARIMLGSWPWLEILCASMRAKSAAAFDGSVCPKGLSELGIDLFSTSTMLTEMLKKNTHTNKLCSILILWYDDNKGFAVIDDNNCTRYFIPTVTQLDALFLQPAVKNSILSQNYGTKEGTKCPTCQYFRP
jgi:hypothetical protein